MAIQMTARAEDGVKAHAERVTDSVDISLLADGIYCVLGPSATLGFVVQDGNLFIARHGREFLMSRSIGESLSFDVCVEMVVDSRS